MSDENNKPTFFNLIEDQFRYGGVKYKNSGEKEVTDILCEDYGFNGLLWCVNKYVYRFKNLGRERDLLKIATYMYIMWLKFGYHTDQPNTDASVCTHVDTKLEFFSTFRERYEGYVFMTGGLKEPNLDLISVNLRKLRNPKEQVISYLLFDIVNACGKIYVTSGFAGEDVDTWNEKESANNGESKA